LDTLPLSSPIDPAVSFADFVRREDPLVSVVITAYQKAPFLLDTIESFAVQAWPHLEILVVNDGSTDDTLAVAAAAKERFPTRTIYLLDKPNGGVSDARNYGFRRAKGRVILTMDGDDQAKPNYIETAVRSLRETGANLFHGIQENFGEQPGEWVPHSYDPYTLRYDNCIPTPAVFDRLLFERVGGYQSVLNYCEDWAFWVSCSDLGLLVARSSERLTRYRIQSTGLQSEHINGRWHDCFDVVAMANEDLYMVNELLACHAHFPTSHGPSLLRVEALANRHPEDWFGRFLTALLCEARGDVQGALDRYLAAHAFAVKKSWQPLLRIGLLLERMGKAKESIPFFHECRIMRPDLGVVVNDKVKEARQLPR
jgi:hypothetical protein